MHRTAWLALVALVTCTGEGAAQQAPAEARRTAVVTTATSPLSIDGVLDEAAWATAAPIGELVQRQPRVGEAPTERTVIRLLHDADNLYVGVQAYDTEPGNIVATQMERDAGLGSDDRIELVFDTFRDQSNAFYFATNPAGTYVDGIAFINGDLNSEWDTIWDVRTQRTAEGWTAEFAIPFKSLNFPEGQSVWGFNVARTISRKLEENRWSGARLDVTRFAQVSDAGEISGLGALTQGKGLDIRPFLAGRRLDLRAADEATYLGKPGFNLFYNFTPSLKLSATVNTDFGETEVDARQINLSRFSVLFPERRQFFLEDAGVFSFASTGPTPAAGIPGTGAEVFPFFSRQVGLLGGQEVPIDVGVKLTGKVGQTDVGFLDVRTRDVAISDAKNFVIGRVRQNFSQQSYIGAIFTDGDPTRSASSRTFGADVRLATARFLGRPRNLVVNAYALRSANEGVSGKDASYGFSVAYPNDRYSAQFVMREIQENFRPAIGFVQRGNVRLLRAAFSFNPRPRFLNLQQMFHDFYYTRFTSLANNQLVSQDFYMTLLDWHVRTGDSFHGMLDLNVVNEHLFAPFVISPGVVLPVGEYTFTRFRSNLLTSATRRRVSGNFTVSWGDYWSGTAEQVQAGIAFRMPPTLTLSVNTNQTFATLPEGSFTARIFTANANYAVSARLSFSNLVQYDNRSENLGWQSRVRWTLRPGDDLFVSFNQGWIREDGEDVRFRTEDNRLAVKLQYAFRF
ncbi:MAG: carbohydrate binding family 9 domain-containing protein [Acidobacteria bacterium]|nr:carbohydrate binding family 9 domain-containing protein [Acidobacteriota bacterium]